MRIIIKNENVEYLRAEILTNGMIRMERAGKVVKDRAQSYAPVDTGALKNSINASQSKDNQDVIGTVGSNLDYAFDQELGNKEIRGKRYLTRGLFDSINMIKRIFGG